MPSMNDAGAYVPWRVRQNYEWKRTMTFKRGGTGIDITGDTFTAHVTAAETSLVSLKDLSPTIITPLSGIVRIEVAGAAATLAGGPGTYWWYLKWVDITAGDTIPVMSGPFTVEP